MVQGERKSDGAVPLRAKFCGHDSSALFINGSDGGEGPEYVTVYRVGDLTSRFLKVREAQNDMVKTFPPCRAKNSNPRRLCFAGGTNPGRYQRVNAIAWTRGSSAIVVVAQMPCSSISWRDLVPGLWSYELTPRAERFCGELTPGNSRRIGDTIWPGTSKFPVLRSMRAIK